MIAPTPATVGTSINQVGDLEQIEIGDKRAVYLRSVAGLGFGVIRSVLIGRLLVPSDVAVFRVTTVWAGYFGFLSLGASDTLHFRGASLLRDRRTAEFLQLRSTALALSLTAGWAAAFGTVILAMALHLTGITTAVLLGVLAAITLLLPFFNSALLSEGRFRDQARYGIWAAAIGTVCVAIGLLVAGIRGLIVGNCIGLICGLWLVRDVMRFQDLKRITRAATLASARFGMKQSTLVFLQGIILSIDLQVLAASSSNAAAVGYYAFAGMLVVAVRTAATAGAIVAQTNLMARHGDSILSRDEILCADAEAQRRVDTALVGLVSATALAAVSAGVQFAFPRFKNSLEPFAAMLLSVTTIRWGFFHAVALSSRGLQWATIPFAVAGIVVAGCWTLVGVKLGWPLGVIALAPAVGSGFYAACTVAFAWRRLDGGWPVGPFARMGMGLIALVPLLAVSNTRPWYANIICALVSIGAQLILLFVLDRPSLNNIAHLLGAMIGRRFAKGVDG